MLVLSGPVWSHDSSAVAVLEKRIDSGALALTTVSTKGRTATVRVPRHLQEDASLTFVESNVVVRSTGGSLLVDPPGKTVGPVPDDIRRIPEQADQLRQRTAESRKNLERVLRRLEAREGAACPLSRKINSSARTRFAPHVQ